MLIGRISKISLFILVIISVTIIYFAVIKPTTSPRSADVLSVEVLNATLPIKREFCDITGIPGPFKAEILQRYHPAESECSAYFLYSTLMQKPDFFANSRYRSSCITFYTTETRIVGYDVTYKLKGKIGKVRINYHPGDRIAVDNSGRLIFNPMLLCQGEERTFPCLTHF